MSGFLLLRDNKQTGPYTIAELRNLDLKSYDLIWQEGKSAAWRYPGEISDLADFAPPVLEQPYDRFYKKPEQAESASEIKTEIQPTTSHVFVSMPETKQKTEKKVEPKIIKEKSEVATVSYSKPSEYVKVSYSEPSEPTKPVATIPGQKGISNRTYDILMKSIFGICLILIGFIVAIYISDLRDSNSFSGNIPPVVEDLDNSSASAGMEASIFPVMDNQADEESNTTIKNVNTASKLPAKKVVVSKPASKAESALVKDEIPVVKENIPAPLSAAEMAAVKKEIMGNISLATNSDYKVSAFGGVDDLKVLLSNNSSHILNKVDIKVNFFNQNRKTVKSQVLNMHNVGAGEIKEISVPKSSRGVEFSVELVSVDPVY